MVLGSHEAATALLEGALLHDQSPDVAEKLGDGYRELGKRTEAARVYSIAAEKNSDSVTVHEKLLGVLLEDDEPLGSALTSYLGALIQRKQIDRAIESASQALAHPKLSEADGRAARTLLAAALAQKDYDVAAFKESAAAGNIRSLIAARSPHTSALVALMHAYDGGIGSKSSTVWADSQPIGPDLLSPLDAFRAVLRSIGSTLSRQSEHGKAVAYYELALSLDATRVDPASVRALASIYASKRMYRQLSELDDTYQHSMSALAAASGKFAAAAAYKKLGNLHLARTAIADLGHAFPDGVDDGDYKRMVHQLVWFPDRIRGNVPSDAHFTVKRNILLLCEGGSRDDRVKAVAELKALGITIDAQERDLQIQRPDGRVVRSRFFLPVSDPRDE